jgi:hypothetical protein
VCFSGCADTEENRQREYNAPDHAIARATGKDPRPPSHSTIMHQADRLLYWTLVQLQRS